VWTTGEMLSMPLLGSMIAVRAGPGSQGRYMGLFTFSFSISMILGPMIGTAVYSTYGPAMLWYGCGVAGVLLSVAFSFLSRSLENERNATPLR
jgi:MFS family permease